MIFVNYIIPIISVIASIFSAIFAYKANTKAKEANEISKDAKNISEKANTISEEANIIAMKALDLQMAPEIRLTKLELDPQKVKVFGGNNIAWIGKNELTDELYKIISESARTDSIIVINNKEYLLINLCYETTSKSDVGIILDAFCFEAECTKNSITELSILKAYSLLNPTIPFEPDIKLNIHIDINTSTITIPIAYACPSNLYSSLNLGSIAKIAKEFTEKINLINTPDMAGKIIGFVETAYLIKCITPNNDEFLYTLYIKRDEDGRLKTPHIYRGEEKYNQYYNIAKDRIGKEIQAIDNTQ